MPGGVTTCPSTAGIADRPGGRPARLAVGAHQERRAAPAGPGPRRAAIASRGAAGERPQRRQFEGVDHRCARGQVGRRQHRAPARRGRQRRPARSPRIRASRPSSRSRQRSTRHVPGVPAIVTRSPGRGPARRTAAPACVARAPRRAASAPPRPASSHRGVERRGQLDPCLARARAPGRTARCTPGLIVARRLVMRERQRAAARFRPRRCRAGRDRPALRPPRASINGRRGARAARQRQPPRHRRGTSAPAAPASVSTTARTLAPDAAKPASDSAASAAASAPPPARAAICADSAPRPASAITSKVSDGMRLPKSASCEILEHRIGDAAIRGRRAIALRRGDQRIGRLVLAARGAAESRSRS